MIVLLSVIAGMDAYALIRHILPILLLHITDHMYLIRHHEHIPVIAVILIMLLTLRCKRIPITLLMPI